MFHGVSRGGLAGFHISEALLDRLVQSVEEQQDSRGAAHAAHATTRSWLKRALPAAQQRRLPGGGGGGRLLAVQPHALDEHVAALVGPLPLAEAGEGAAEPHRTASSLMEFSDAGDRFVGLALLRRARSRS